MIVRLLQRYRRSVILSAAVVCSFLLMSLEARRETDALSFLHQVFTESVSPLIKVTTYSSHALRDVWNAYIDLRHVREENVRLKEQVQVLEMRLQRVEGPAHENRQLKELLGLRTKTAFRTVAALVVGKDSMNWFRSLLIDKGLKHGVRRHMAVIAPKGLVGQVVEVTPWTARVQLITDPVSSVGALLRQSRVRGLVVGELGSSVRIKYLPVRAEVTVGEAVVTSGMGRVYPKGIVIGRVASVSRKKGALFQEARVDPGVDFIRLEEVLVVLDGRPGTDEERS
ncbi:MAG: rod shape-determining protein MreC [Candidatus Methylomirabilales bacterium]